MKKPPGFLEEAYFHLGGGGKGMGKGVVVYSTTDVRECVAYLFIFSLKAGSMQEPDVGLDLGTQDHTLGRRQMLNHRATQGSPISVFLQQSLSFVLGCS